jgi:hypothetical protein
MLPEEASEAAGASFSLRCWIEAKNTRKLRFMLREG